MIAGLPETERAWLETFFGAPNELTWANIEAADAPADRLDAVMPWLSRLLYEGSDAPIILPFYHGGGVAGWYATASTKEGEQRLRATLRAWFGPSYLSHLQAADPANPSAAAMQTRFGRQVLAFRGPDRSKISDRLALLAKLDAQRPELGRSEPRPVGRVRSELERALLSRDEAKALTLIAELRGSGRLNEENLRFLDIRLKAGLSQWEQIARDHWTIKTLADLPLPPQTLSDLIEALYRVYVDDAEAVGDAQAVRLAFEDRVAKPFPRLFASRHGVRTPRVVKAFALHESLQPRPDATILEGLLRLLPADDSAWVDAFIRPEETPKSPVVATAPVEPAVRLEDDAEIAFDDGQYDRAFELHLAKPLHRKSLSALLSCVQFIATAEARRRLLDAFDAQPATHAGLPSALVDRLENFREKDPAPESEVEQPLEPAGWMRWARRLATGYSPDAAEAEVLNDRATWEASWLRVNSQLCAEFSDLIGNLTGGAVDVARRSLPLIISAFFPEGLPTAPATKPLATVILLLIAMDEAVARGDLEILSTVLSALLDLGLSTQDYLTTIADLEAVQDRVASYANLAWSLDVCEILAISPSPSTEASEARLRFFLKVVGQSRSFAHRLGPHDFLPIEYLARDYGVDPSTVADLRPALKPVDEAENGAILAGKTVGIYTLTNAAGGRAKSVLKQLFPLCTVEVNSDTVCTSSLTNLARTADIFVFAWRSSSHQAFFCVKDALGGRDPVYAAGKGTASLVNAVRAAAQ
ncbi:MAG: protein DpdD [Steroidobacteraceae bacterium]